MEAWFAVVSGGLCAEQFSIICTLDVMSMYVGVIRAIPAYRIVPGVFGSEWIQEKWIVIIKRQSTITVLLGLEDLPVLLLLENLQRFTTGTGP